MTEHNPIGALARLLEDARAQCRWYRDKASDQPDEAERWLAVADAHEYYVGRLEQLLGALS